MQPRLLIAIIFFVLPFISFSQAGTLDNSFGVNGKVLTRFKGLNSDAYSVLKQSDEKIITAGEYFDSLNINTGIALARYYPNGNLDSAFGISGLVTTKSFGDEDQPNSAALQSDGKIVVVANSFNNGYSNINLEVLRYSSTGKLDSSFGKNGRTIPNLGFYSSGYAIAIQSNGNILVSGVTADSGKYTEFLLVQFLINGDLDSSFGLNGFIRTSFENFATVGYSLALQSDGKIIVGGRTSDSISNKTLMSFFRFNKNGTPDSSFGINGKALIGSNESAEIKSVALQSDGKIVGGGNSYANNQGDYIIVRLKSNGKIDSSFGINGETITDIYGGYDKLKSIVINADNKVIAAGYASIAPDYSQINFELVRYKSSGIIDSSFGIYGKQTTDFYSKNDNARSMLLQKDQKIVVAGYAEDTLVNFALARYNNDVVLAVNFTSFTATKNNQSVFLNWNTCSEINCKGFSIERSSNRNNWSSLGFNVSKGGGTVCNNNYVFTDRKPLNGNNFYRLKQIDKDEHTTNSKIIRVSFETPFKIKISPNPAINSLTISGLEKNTDLSIINSVGVILKTVKATSGTYNWNLAGLSSGNYFLTASQNSKQIISFEFIKR